MNSLGPFKVTHLPSGPGGALEVIVRHKGQLQEAIDCVYKIREMPIEKTPGKGYYFSFDTDRTIS